MTGAAPRGPEDLAQWLVWASVGFCEATLRLAGARSPRVSILDVSPDGHNHRRDLVKVDLRLVFA